MRHLNLYNRKVSEWIVVTSNENVLNIKRTKKSLRGEFLGILIVFIIGITSITIGVTKGRLSKIYEEIFKNPIMLVVYIILFTIMIITLCFSYRRYKKGVEFYFTKNENGLYKNNIEKCSITDLVNIKIDYDNAGESNLFLLNLYYREKDKLKKITIDSSITGKDLKDIGSRISKFLGLYLEVD